METPEIDPASAPVRILWLVDALTPELVRSRVLPFADSLDPERLRLLVAGIGSGAAGGAEPELEGRGIRAAHFDARGVRDLAAFRRLTRFLRIERVRVVHSEGTRAGIWASLAARRTGVPCIATVPAGLPGETLSGRDGLRERLLRWSVGRYASRIRTGADPADADGLSALYRVLGRRAG